MLSPPLLGSFSAPMSMNLHSLCLRSALLREANACLCLGPSFPNSPPTYLLPHFESSFQPLARTLHTYRGRTAGKRVFLLLQRDIPGRLLHPD